MTPELVTSNPFALLTFIAAPALLTNASSVLALSTSNRFLRAGERMRVVAAELEKAVEPAEREWRLVHMNRIERQALLLLLALRAVYAALGSFVGASLITIVGAALAAREMHPLDSMMMALGLLAGFFGAGAMIWGSVNLFRATRLSMLNISEEAEIIRRRANQRQSSSA